MNGNLKQLIAEDNDKHCCGKKNESSSFIKKLVKTFGNEVMSQENIFLMLRFLLMNLQVALEAVYDYSCSVNYFLSKYEEMIAEEKGDN